MRVAAVHDLPTGGALRVLAEWLARTTADEAVIYTGNPGVHEFVGIDDRVPVIERRMHRGDGAIDELWRLIRSPADGARLAAEIDNAGYDVVFCHASRVTQAPDVLPFLRTPSLYYAPEPLRAADEPKQLVRASDGLRGAINRLGLNPLAPRRERLDRRYMQSAKHIVTHSHFTQGRLRDRYGVDSEVVHLGVDSDTFTPPATGATRDGYVLSVGALHPLKGHEFVIEALATIPPPRPRLVVVADRGDAGGPLRELADASQVELDLRIRIPLTEVVSAYQRAGVVACAQIREPFGLVPLEAMACETPVVAVADGGFRETVSDQVTGLLVPRDAHAMGAAVSRVLTNPALATQLGAAGRRAVESEWTWERCTAQFDRMLEEIARAPLAVAAAGTGRSAGHRP